MTVPNATSYWTLDDDTIGGLGYKPTPDKVDDNLSLKGGMISNTGYIGEGPEFVGDASKYLIAGGSANLVEEIFQATHTIAVWVKFDTVNVAQTVVSNGYAPDAFGSANNNGLSLGLEGSGKFRAIFCVTNTELYTDSNGNSATSSFIQAKSNELALAGVWYHLTVTFNTNTAKLYVNGSLVASVTTAQNGNFNPSNSSSNFTVGAQRNYGSGTLSAPTDGVVDELKVWNVVLTDAQVLEHYNSYLTPEVASVQMFVGSSGANRKIWDSTPL